MSTPHSKPEPVTLESVLHDAWDAFHPGQPAPLGWLTHTTTRIHDHLRAQRTAPPTPPPPDAEPAARLRQRVWQTLREAASEHDIDADAADRILHALDLPGLPRRWHVRLTVPVLIEITATSREDAFDAAEDALDTALTRTGRDSHADWDAATRADATPGDLDTSADEPADLR